MPKIIFQPLMISNPAGRLAVCYEETSNGNLFYSKKRFLCSRFFMSSILFICNISLQYIIFNISLQYITCDVIFSLCLYLNPQRFLIAATSWVSTFFSSSSGRLQKKSMPVLSSRVLIFTT